MGFFNFGRFVQASDYFSSGNLVSRYFSPSPEDQQLYRKLASKDKNGNRLCVPMVVANQRDELRVYGVEGFNRNFTSVASLIANPGQGKSRLATTIYNIMRGTNEKYFKTSEGAVSFTKGVWRLSDHCKVQAMSKDAIDILDVEGLQKENSVYCLLISVVVLSKSIVLLSRERVNKEALGLLEIAFKTLNRLGIALKKPVIFVQTKINKNGHLIDGDGQPMTRGEFLKNIAREIPIIKHFQVEFFRIREIPVLEVLEEAGLDEETARATVSNATKLYESDVKDLLKRLVAVRDPLPSEQRMHYLIKVLDHLNNKNPDLVLEQNLEFYEKDLERFLGTEVCREREDLVQKHLTKPLGDACTLAEFFEPPEQKLEDKFIQYSEEESPFLGNTRDTEAYKAAAKKVFNNSQYAKGVLKATDPKTGEVIGIMSYVQPSFEAKRKTEESVLMDIYNTLKAAVEGDTSFNLFFSSLPKVPPANCVAAIKDKHPGLSGIDGIISGRWKQVCTDLQNRKTSLLSESKWVQKVRNEGNRYCNKCHQDHNDLLSHKGCQNHRDVPSILWHWIKGSTSYGICNGCEDVRKIQSMHCWTCGGRLSAKPIPPNW